MKDPIYLAIDMDNAVNYPKADNFTVLLLRLILKADSDNRAKLAMGFPEEVKMVQRYRDGTLCPYREELAKDGFRIVDFQKLAEMAVKEATP